MANDKPTESPGIVSATVTAMVTGSVWKMKTYEATLSLPPTILQRIGQIAVHWAAAEYLLAGMQYDVLNLDRKEGRVYDQEPRLKDVTETVTKVGGMRGLNFPFKEWMAFTGKLTECDKIRNKYLHGIWFVHETDGLCLQDIKGNWPTEKGVEPVAKKRYPGRIPVTQKTVDDDFVTIRDTLHEAQEFRDKLTAAVAAWRAQS